MAKLKKDGTESKQGEGGGRPPKYKNEDELNTVVKQYFIQATNTSTGAVSKAGLLFKLDIDRSTYSDYKKKYPNTLRQAEMAIEEWWVARLSQNGATGAIFYLKNAFKEEYKDRTETDITSGGKQIQPILGGLSKKK